MSQPAHALSVLRAVKRGSGRRPAAQGMLVSLLAEVRHVRHLDRGL